MKILITGGTGDVIATECYYPIELRQNLTHLYLACRPHNNIRELFTNNPAYPKLQEIVTLWDKFDEQVACFRHKLHLVNFLRKQGISVNLEGVDDFSIREVFYKIKGTALRFSGSSFFDPNTTKHPFAVIHPLTDSIPRREFTADEWDYTLNYLQQHKLVGIVLGAEEIPNSPYLVKRKTTIQEAVKLTSTASHFFGIDSCLSVVAGMCLPPERMRVYTSSAHLVAWRKIYYPTQTDFSFLIVSPPEDAKQRALLTLVLQHDE